MKNPDEHGNGPRAMQERCDGGEGGGFSNGALVADRTVVLHELNLVLCEGSVLKRSRKR